ncbi:MAG: NUDIX domain-containing protein [Nitrospiraceae bacterium]|nr:NUDIX domain-containing protein [Nitrospiraceae bacterium]
MTKTSAGLLLYKRTSNELRVFLIHPGGPFFIKKDDGAWSIPKGLLEPGEDPLAAAQREFAEETGCRPEGQFLPLSPVQQKGGKIVLAWAVEADCDADDIVSNTFDLEWPPHSGRIQQFPEADRAAWFSIEEAKKKIIPAQIAFLDELQSLVSPR